ncbi:MAG: M36 family metallopeptidase, partial [Deltaproteobacteria bacterium]|nr:M36 family metallopeptidase [Deltaproteobacteria bacterium]
MIRATLLLIALTSALGRPAYAFAPVDDGAQGIEGDRVLAFDPHVQIRLAKTEPWRRFLATEGGGWRARFDEQMGTPHRMWGAPIDLGPADSARAVEAGLLDFVDRHHELLGTDSTQLRLRSARHVTYLDTWYVDFDVLVGGMPVEGGGITARLRHGGLVMLGAETYPLASLQGTRRMSQDLAVDRAIAFGPAPRAHHTDVQTTLVAVPVVREGEVLLRPAWRTSSRTVTPLGDWETYVDADDGTLLGTRNRVRYATGEIFAEHDLRTVDGQTTVSPLPYVQVTDGSTTVYADALGGFELPGTSATATLEGSRFRVFNDSGPEASLTFDGPEGLFDDETSTPAERDTYVFLHQVHEWGLRVAPGVMPNRMDAYVNVGQTCNAYFDGAVNFFEAGDGCNNTGRIADVVYHEWGHGLHYYSLESGIFDGSLSEGAADTVAFLQTGDNIIAPYFMTNGQGIRNVAPDRVYPDDYVANDAYVHSNGLIFAGAMWDLWDALVDEHGEEDGTARVEHILTGLLKGGPTVVESYDEAMFADDDDGDLENGTPNLCLLAEAFGQHGLGPLGSGTTFLAHHEPTTDADPGSPSELEVDLVPVAEQCFPFDPEAAIVHYRVKGGEWQTAPLDIEVDTAAGAIPPLRLGDFVEYYVRVEDGDGSSVTVPEGGVINPFSFYVGDALSIHCDDFE